MSRKKKLKKMPLATVPNCIFCGKPANSREDAFPVWLIEMMDEWYALRFKLDGPPIPDILECIDGVGGKSEIRLQSLKILIKCVCKDCNSGWMSNIQDVHAKPVITRLLEEKTHTLDRQDCTSLTIWSVMTSMVLDIRNEPHERRFTEEEHCLFWNKHRILSNNYIQENIYVPKDFQVWIARWKNSPGPSVLGRLLSTTGSPHKGVVNTIGFGTLIFQIVRTTPGIDPGARPGPWDRSLVRIFPPPGEPVAFPPPLEFEGYDGIEELEMRFSPPGADTGRPSEEEYRRITGILHSKFPRPGQSPPA